MHRIFTNQRIRLATFGVAVAASLLMVVPVAQAGTLSSSQVSAIINLLQVFGADASVVANVQAVLTGTALPAQSTGTATSTPSVNGPGNATSCMSLSGTLSFGSQGEDVTKLQQFLAKDSNIYPSGLVTGFYGHATEDAIQRYQAAHGIVATGTPATTGYGAVGPATRGELEREMETECNSGDTQGASGDHASATSTAAHEGEGSSGTASSSAQSSDN